MLCAALLSTLFVGAPIPIVDAVAIGGVARGGRLPVPADAVLAKIVDGSLGTPQDGATVARLGGGDATWKSIHANADGWLEDAALRGGYAYATVESPKAEVRILEAAGHSLVYVNGEPRGGDPYGFGYFKVPVQLRQGTNAFLFSVGRGRLHATLTEPPAGAYLDLGDPTLPDVLVGLSRPLLGAVVVVNAKAEPLVGARLVARVGDQAVETEVPTLAALSMRKVPFSIRTPRADEAGEQTLELDLIQTEGRSRLLLNRASTKLRVRTPLQVHRRTFESSIDGSVQYFAVNPAQKPATSNTLILTLHGASVEGEGQAAAYGSKEWATLVAPTNRRPYGFDWEDWGRWDALEVLEIAKRTIPHDRRKVDVTGHSMGGHGTWHMGVTFPDLWGVIAPSAGWSSFFSYGGTPRFEGSDPIDAILTRAVSPSDTLLLARNTLSDAVYILHGDKDDNVPVSEARLMKETLEKLGHTRLSYHEQPGAGHWWGGECVDWPPMFDLFKTVERPSPREVKSVDFTTMNPAVSNRDYWASIEQQIHALQPSRIQLTLDGDTLRGTTENVAWLAIDRRLTRFTRAVLDGQTFENLPPTGATAHFERKGDTWERRPELPRDVKRADRSGPFKEAFKNRMVFVVGTAGTPEENAWASAKARYDSETFQYRGNGSVDIVRDTAFDPVRFHGRNVILYGNADTNSAWPKVLGEGGIVVKRGSVVVGGRSVAGDDLAALFVAPRTNDSGSLVGVVAATGPKGAEIATRLPYFVSGVAYPDWIVIGADSALLGNQGIRGAGFYGNDWKVESGDQAWRNAPGLR
ncbi:MAG: prolyl oligopeptidase family serine peptidase [Fimbriimonadaceae bacterium]|nr:prolyl oligopeptidase family serine peptidase [Fimbriimonadaceae bacterium]